MPMSLNRVIAYAEELHRGQHDKAGQPYVLHLARVAAGVQDFGLGLQMAAWLHDAVEDHPDRTSLRLLAQMGVPYAVVDMVDCLTKRPDELYHRALERVVPNYGALLVKLADNADNSSEERLARIADEGKRARLRTKYAEARKFLLPHVAVADALAVYRHVNPALADALELNYDELIDGDEDAYRAYMARHGHRT